jgi:hypothetical protein
MSALAHRLSGRASGVVLALAGRCPHRSCVAGVMSPVGGRSSSRRRSDSAIVALTSSSVIRLWFSVLPSGGGTSSSKSPCTWELSTAEHQALGRAQFPSARAGRVDLVPVFRARRWRFRGDPYFEQVLLSRGDDEQRRVRHRQLRPVSTEHQPRPGESDGEFADVVQNPSGTLIVAQGARHRHRHDLSSLRTPSKLR